MQPWSDHLALRPPLVAAGLAAGIASSTAFSTSLLVVPFLGLAILTIVSQRWLSATMRVRLSALFCIVALGGVLPSWRTRPGLDEDERDPDGARALTEVRGVVLRPAEPLPGPRYLLRVRAGERVLRASSPIAAEPGDELRLLGRLRPLRGQKNVGSQDRAAAARADGLDADFSAESVTRVGRDGAWPLALWRSVGALRRRWAAAIMPTARDVPPSPAVTALAGVTLGLRADVPEVLSERWRAVGIYHVLSVSGLHLAVVALLAFGGLRRVFAAASPRVDPARLALVPALALAVGYTLVTGAQVATLRALLIAALWMISVAAGRPLRMLDALAVAAIALLLWAPGQLSQAPFQLSFAAASALALHPTAAANADLRVWARTLRWLGRGASTSAWVALVTAPISAYHFHQVLPGGVLGNLILTPLVELAALPAGLAGLVLGELSPTAGGALLHAAAAILAFADAVAERLQPWCPVGEVAIRSPWLAVGLCAAALVLCARKSRGVIDLAAWCAMCALWLCAPLPPPAGLRVVFFDVGQGDAALIETRTALWLIDAGGSPGASSVEAAAAPGRAIVDYLALRHRRRIDLAILSHPHPDHYLGMLAVVPAIEIAEPWLPPGFVREGTAPEPSGGEGPPTATPSFAEVVDALRRAGTKITAPPVESVRLADGAALTLLAPRYRAEASLPEQLAADPVRSVNDNSAVAALRYANRRVLFAGDLELEGEEALLSNAPALAVTADVIKVPHHGSRTSSSASLVAAVAAKVAVISCGAGNRFGLPNREVIERWQQRGTEVLRTDRGGAVIVEISPEGELEISRP